MNKSRVTSSPADKPPDNIDAKFLNEVQRQRREIEKNTYSSCRSSRRTEVTLPERNSAIVETEYKSSSELSADFE